MHWLTNRCDRFTRTFTVLQNVGGIINIFLGTIFFWLTRKKETDMYKKFSLQKPGCCVWWVKRVREVYLDPLLRLRALMMYLQRSLRDMPRQHFPAILATLVTQAVGFFFSIFRKKSMKPFTCGLHWRLTFFLQPPPAIALPFPESTCWNLQYFISFEFL